MKVSLASATVEQLDELPGVGPVTAQKIVDWRTTHGPFRSVDDLDDVRASVRRGSNSFATSSRRETTGHDELAGAPRCRRVRRSRIVRLVPALAGHPRAGGRRRGVAAIVERDLRRVALAAMALALVGLAGAR